MEPEQEAEAVLAVECDCLCGAQLRVWRPAQVFCDECSCGRRANDAVFHCAKGFNLCTKRAAKKAAADQNKDKAKGAEVVEPPQEEDEPLDNFVFARQLAQIKQIMALEGGDMDEVINAD